MSAYKNRNKPKNNGKYRQGYFNPVNKDKYIGDYTKIIYRSTYEYRFCKFCDDSPDILTWASEPFAIKYFDPVKNKLREYYTDFFIKYRKGDVDKSFLVEVKPKAKLHRPIFEGNQTIKKLKSFNYEMAEYITNKAKMGAAKTYSENMGYQFMVVTEDFLFKNELSK